MHSSLSALCKSDEQATYSRSIFHVCVCVLIHSSSSFFFSCSVAVYDDERENVSRLSCVCCKRVRPPRSSVLYIHGAYVACGRVTDFTGQWANEKLVGCERLLRCHPPYLRPPFFSLPIPIFIFIYQLFFSFHVYKTLIMMSFCCCCLFFVTFI